MTLFAQFDTAGRHTETESAGLPFSFTPLAVIQCPNCDGQGQRLRPLGDEWTDEPCPMCGGEGIVLERRQGNRVDHIDIHNPWGMLGLTKAVRG